MIAPMPYTFQSKTRAGIVTALRQRLSLFSYMRASLRDISANGGVLHTPLFAIFSQYPFTENILAAKDVSGFMYGPALRVELQYKQFTYEKEVRFPAGSRWVRLNTWETYVAPKNQEYLSIMAKTGIDKEVNIYQMDSTIVPLQDASTVIRIEDLVSVPFTLSVVLGGSDRTA
jgi:alpha-glucosidase (family GH31 glycosyl hydrolase)